MNVTQNNIDKLNLELTVEVAAADYAGIEKKKLSARRRTADFKGFRKGNVPMGMIQKVFGEQCLAEAVNEVIGDALDRHISGLGLHILGEPLTSESQPENEWKSGNDFVFKFDVALSPEVSVEVSKDDSVPQYNVSIAAKDKSSMAESLRKYYDEKKEEKSDEDIDKEAAERLKEQYANEARWRLDKDIRDYFVGKSALELPEDFLKRWLFVANGGKVTREDIEKDFAGFAEDFKWQMVRGFLMKKYGLKVEESDIREAAESFVSYQYAMYGLNNVPEDILSEAVVNMLQDSKQVERLSENVEDRKVFAKLKEEITLKPTKITSAKFREL